MRTDTNSVACEFARSDLNLRGEMATVLCVCEMINAAQPSACGFVRLFLPLSKQVVRARFDLRFVTMEDLRFLRADIVVAHRTAARTREEANWLIAWCADTGARLVFDMDDDLLSLDDYHPELEKYEQVRPAILALIAAADELWVSTRSLADRFGTLARRIEIMPNELDCRIWRGRVVEAGESSGKTRFLYMGTATHRPDFDRVIRPALFMLREEFGERVEIDVIGATDESCPRRTWNIVRPPAGVDISYPAFSTWLQSLTGYDAGLAPLLDTPFNRCKSDLKWLEYSAMGLATIAADLPAYNESIEHGRTGWLVDAQVEGFREAIRRMLLDPPLLDTLKRGASHLVAERLERSPTTEPRIDRLARLATSVRA